MEIPQPPLSPFGNGDLAASDVALTADDLREIAGALSEIRVAGARGTGHERYG